MFRMLRCGFLPNRDFSLQELSVDFYREIMDYVRLVRFNVQRLKQALLLITYATFFPQRAFTPLFEAVESAGKRWHYRKSQSALQAWF
uniref:Uncharacterized protein n=1 Tax=Trichuris muris TaxID=70415 RepID=A0A5S6PYM7_TRIMR